ncbi:MAG: hypothetical protein LBJ00_13715 [Planctomycetaceae bacterium]|nr:hypothetical protein [Planctomycetaceae bacterium]
MNFPKRNTQAQQREAIAQGRSLLPYRLRYIIIFLYFYDESGFNCGCVGSYVYAFGE